MCSGQQATTMHSDYIRVSQPRVLLDNKQQTHNVLQSRVLLDNKHLLYRAIIHNVINTCPERATDKSVTDNLESQTRVHSEQQRIGMHHRNFSTICPRYTCRNEVMLFHCPKLYFPWIKSSKDRTKVMQKLTWRRVIINLFSGTQYWI
jgi:hypothetical protein